MEKDNKKIVPDSEAPVWFAVVFDWETGEILATGVEDKKTRSDAESTCGEIIKDAEQYYPDAVDLYTVVTYDINVAKDKYYSRKGEYEGLCNMADKAQGIIDELEAKDILTDFEKQELAYFKDTIFDLHQDIDAMSQGCVDYSGADIEDAEITFNTCKRI